MAAHEHWLLTDVPSDLLRPAFALGIERHYDAGAVIMREGEAPDGLYLILSGSIRVTARNEHGETLLTLIRANEVLGEMGVIDGEPRSGTATALNPAVVFFLPTEAFLRLLEVSSLVSNRLLILLSERLRLANRRLLELQPSGPVSRRTTPITP